MRHLGSFVGFFCKILETKAKNFLYSKKLKPSQFFENHFVFYSKLLAINSQFYVSENKKSSLA
jgi:hypothetical protein